MGKPEESELFYALSVITTVLCIVLKLPQIKTIIKSKSVRGLSKSSLMLEFWRYESDMSTAANLTVLLTQLPHHSVILDVLQLSVWLVLGVPEFVAAGLAHHGADDRIRPTH